MSPRTPSIADLRRSSSHRFIVAGVSITSMRRHLKPALPKKKQEASYTVLITTPPDRVRFTIAGAAIEMPAMISGPFVAEIPFLHFKWLLTEPFQDGALIEFELSPGSFAVSGMAVKTPQIIVQSGNTAAADKSPTNSASVRAVAEPSRASSQPSSTEAPPAFFNPMDAPMGLPLLGVYKYIRKYGIQRSIVSQSFVKQQLEVEKLLDTADTLLKPFAITRSDLEKLLDRKVESF